MEGEYLGVFNWAPPGGGRKRLTDDGAECESEKDLSRSINPLELKRCSPYSDRQLAPFYQPQYKSFKMVKYKLTYFNLMGLGEPIRLLFAYLGQEFEDVRIERADWPKHKQNFPYGQLPVLEVDGKVVCQSSAICRYLGKKAGLAGQDDWEALQIDMVVDIFHDFRVDFSKFIREPDPAAKEKLKEVLFKEKIPFYFGKLEEMLKSNGGYFVNGKLSWADLVITSMCQTMNKVLNEQITEKYPNIHQLINKVNTHPKLKEYITNRPLTEL